MSAKKIHDYVMRTGHLPPNCTEADVWRFVALCKRKAAKLENEADGLLAQAKDKFGDDFKVSES
jgi:hypothetical protein